MSLKTKALAKKTVSVSPHTLSFLAKAASILEIPIPEELADKKFLLCQTMWLLQEEDKESAAQRKVDGEIEKLLLQETELAQKLAAKGQDVEIPEGGAVAVDALTESKRRASEIRERVKGLQQKIPKRAPTEWSAFKWKHTGERLCPAEMSELYRAESEAERKKILEEYKVHLATRDE